LFFLDSVAVEAYLFGVKHVLVLSGAEGAGGFGAWGLEINQGKGTS